MKLRYITLTAVSLGILILQNNASADCPPFREVSTLKAIDNLLLGGATPSGWRVAIMNKNKTHPTHPFTMGISFQKQQEICPETYKSITISQLTAGPQCNYSVTCHPVNVMNPSKLIGYFTLEIPAGKKPSTVKK